MTSKGAFAGVFPDVPGEMFASAEHHSTVTVTPALECLCWCWSVSFVYADDRMSDKGSGHVGGRSGVVVVVVVVVVVLSDFF